MKKIIPENSILIPDEAELVFKGKHFNTYHWQQKLYDGSYTTFEMLKRRDTARVIAVKDDKLVLIDEQQVRHFPNRHFPTGKIDAGEDWLHGAQRELREETGLEFAHWRLIHVAQPFDQIEWFVATYLATDCTAKHMPELEAGEKSTVLYASFNDVKQQVTAGRDDLKHSYELFRQLNTLHDLLRLPDFLGEEVDR